MVMTNPTPQKNPGGKPHNANISGLDFAAEDKHWRDQYKRESYFSADHTYDDYAPAYRVGYEGAGRYAGRKFDEVETDLRRDYDSLRGTSKLNWEKAKSAARAAWDRIERAMPGDADGDGR
jgi:hypothetical protein